MSRPASPWQSTPSEDRLRVLVADDGKVDQLVAVRLLERCGHRAQVVNNGIEALSALEEHLFDAVVMDVDMPELDGMAATRSVRQNEQPGKRVPIIAVSATEGASACISSGADAYLSKPLTLDRLRETLLSMGIGNQPPAA